MTLSIKQQDLIIGSLLGTGNLQTSNGQTWSFSAIHKLLHEPYLYHKYDILKEYCEVSPKCSKILDEQTQKSYEKFYFNTLVSDDFRFYGQLLYKQDILQKNDDKWIKHIPNNIKKYLTPAALAYWYMDSGALKWAGRSNSVRLCTDSFPNYQVRILKEALESNFDLEIEVQSKNNITRLSISEDSYPKLKNLIFSYLLPSMYYKFPDGNKGVYNDEDITNDLFNRFI
jgi:hypothetical protein